MSHDPTADSADETTSVTSQLDTERPRPSPALRRRVNFRIRAAIHGRALRWRSAALVVSGLGLLAVAAALTINVPN